jgi:hypothetical protein
MTKSKAPIREKLWLWGHDAGAHNDSWGLPGPSRITPVEAAAYLGIPNLLMVRYHGRPSLPFDQYAVPMRSLNQVIWSIVGAEGLTDEMEREHVLGLAARHSNITGVIMDDFFAGAFDKQAANRPAAALSLEQLRELRAQLSVAGRRLDLWAVLYAHQLAWPLGDYLKLLDKLSFWTWDSAQLKQLESNFAKLEAVAPASSKVLGCYLWDYAKKQPMPLDLMQRQCRLGREWLEAGRIEGMIFLASCVCDLELQAVEWLHRWIAD